MAVFKNTTVKGHIMITKLLKYLLSTENIQDNKKRVL